MKKILYALERVLAVVVLALCLLYGAPCEQAQAKTTASAPAQQLFFYVTNSEGQDVLARIVSLEELATISHGQLADVVSGEDTGVNYYYSYTDNLPTIGYAEARGFTLPELLSYVKTTSNLAGMDALTYAGTDIMSFMASDSWGSYTKSWSWNSLYNVDRYYFPLMLDASDGWSRDWEVLDADGSDSIAKYGISLEEYHSSYQESDSTYAAKRAAFASGTKSQVILSLDSYAGRVTSSAGEGSEVGLAELVAANQGVVTGSLAEVLDRDYALRLLIPITEADLMCGHRTAYDNMKWIYSVRLNMAQYPSIDPLGEVATPQAQVAVDGNTMTITMTCATPDTAIYYSVQDNNNELDSAGSPQYLYEEPIVIDISDRDIITNPVHFYMTAVKEGYTDAGIVSGQYPLAAPEFQTVYTANIGGELVFTAKNSVSDTEWKDWLSSMSSLCFIAPDSSEPITLSANDYQADDAARSVTIPLDPGIFLQPGSYSFILSATGYADTTYGVQLNKLPPQLRTSSVYAMGQAITIRFDDPYYQQGATVKITPPDSVTASTISTTYLDRTVAGQISIKAGYYNLLSCKIKSAGQYQLTITNNSYTPSTQTVTITVVDATDLPVYDYVLRGSTQEVQAGEWADITLGLSCDHAFILYGGQYRLIYDSNVWELDEESIASVWSYGVDIDTETGMGVLTFAVLEGQGLAYELNEQSQAAGLDIASFRLKALSAGEHSLTPGTYLLSDQDASAKLNVTANALSFTVSGTQADYLLGDVNDDAVIAISDAVLLCRFLAGYESFTQKQSLAADLDKDGSVAAADVVLLLRYLAGYITTFDNPEPAALVRGAALFAATDLASTVEAPVVSVSSQVALAGNTVSVPVVISGNPGLAGMTLQVEYDSSVMRLTGITEGEILKEGMFTANPAQGLLNWVNATDCQGDGTLVSLEFTINSQAVNGCYDVALSLRDGDPENLCNDELEVVDAYFSAGQITISGGLPGNGNDEDNDGDKSDDKDDSPNISSTDHAIANSSGFVDVRDGDWYASAVAELTKLGLFQGVSGTRFEPYTPVNRAMLVTVLWRLEGRPAADSAAFADVSAASWYAQPVGWAWRQGLVTGYNSSSFGPLDCLTREQLAAILYRYAQSKGLDIDVSGDLNRFNDAADVSGWATPAMRWAVGTNLLQGSDGRLFPTENANRAQVAIILQRFIENMGKEDLQ